MSLCHSWQPTDLQQGRALQGKIHMQIPAQKMLIPKLLGLQGNCWSCCSSTTPLSPSPSLLRLSVPPPALQHVVGSHMYVHGGGIMDSSVTQHSQPMNSLGWEERWKSSFVQGRSDPTTNHTAGQQGDFRGVVHTSMPQLQTELGKGGRR